MSPRSTVRVSRARWLIGSSWIRDSILLALLLLVLPVLLDEFRLRSIGGFLAFAILALSLDFVWGFGGIISFGQGAFFGLGAYSIALGLTTWHFPFASFIGIFAGIGISGLLALLLGWFIFHGRVGTFYVAVFTLALSVVFQQLALQFRGITGGYNGIIIPERVMPQSPVMAYYVMLAILFAVLLLLVGVVRSDFGRVLIAIRDNEERARFLGYDVARVQTWAFGLAGALAAVGGMAYASYVQLASPDLIGFGFSTAVLIWVAVGGRGSLVGAAIGALLVNVGSQELGARLLLYWQLVLGTAFMATVLLVPEGLYSLVKRLTRRFENLETAELETRPWSARGMLMEPNGTVLQVRGLKKSFGHFRALDGVDIELLRGELRCLIGPNGAGKSTLVDVLSGRESASDGAASMLGKPILRRSPHSLALGGLRRKFQATNVFDTLSVAENLYLAASAGSLTLGSFMHRTGRLSLPDPVMHLVRNGRLVDSLQRKARELSHGEKKWLELCMVLASEPILVLLDEPTAGLTGDERRQIGASLRKLTEEGLSVMLIEHDFDFVREVADRVTVLHQGRVIADGTVPEVSGSRTVRDVYLGTSA